MFRAAKRTIPERAGEWDIGEVTKRAAEFQTKFEALKAQIGPADFPWYPYSTFGAFSYLDKLLTGEHRDLGHLIGADPVIDIGPADGPIAFFFESLGCRVHAVDYAPINHNGMRGIMKLKAALQSSVVIQEVDLDSSFSLPADRYGLAFFLGVLYHLKNPFHVLQRLARKVQYCFLSTWTAEFAPGDRTPLRHLPVAYLVDEAEVNQDDSNYWVFSEAGLRRILKRSRWEVCAYLSTGNLDRSDPARARGDERTYCFLKSLAFPQLAPRVDLGSACSDEVVGPTWYRAEAGIRWMPAEGTVRLHGADDPSQRLYISGYCPARQLLNGPVTIFVNTDGYDLGSAVLERREAPFTFDFALPPVLAGRREIEVRLRVEPTFTPDGEQRSLGAAFSVFEVR